MSDGQPTSRRDFLASSAKTAAFAGLAAAGGCAAGQAASGLRVVQGPKPKPVDKVINIGIIGAGGRGTSVLSTMLKQNEVPIELKAMAEPDDRNREKALKTIQEITGKTPEVYTGVDDWKNQLLARDDIHAVLIAVPCYLHAEMYLGAFAAGKHFYGEKPMCITVKEADALVAAQKRNPEVVGWIGFQRRGSLKYQEGIQHIRDGLLGNVMAGYGAWNNAWGPLGLPDGTTQVWFGRRKMSGDWMLEQACHTWDVFNWVADALPEAAAGAGRAGVFKDLDPERDVTDFYNAIVKYPNGFILDFEHNWLMPKTDKGLFGGIFERVMGPKGGIDFGEGKFYPREEKGEIKDFSHGENQNLAAAMSFFNSILQRKPAVSGVENGRMATLTGLLVRKAVYEERWVTMKEILAEG